MEKINNLSNKRIIAFLFAVFAVFVWGVTFVSTKYLLKDFSAVEILFFRFIAAYICLWIIYPKKLVIKDIKKELSFLFAGFTGVTMYQLFENMAINYTNASNVSIIVSICPLFTAITSQLFFKQKSITKSFVIGFFIAIIGVILVSFNGVVEFNLNPKGDMLALLSGICWGFYSLFVSKINSYSYNAIASTRRIFFYAIIFMLPVAILGSQFASPEKHSLFMDFSLSVNIERFSNLYNLFNILFLVQFLVL